MRQVKGVCPFCGAGVVTLRDEITGIYGCSCGRYWRTEDDVNDELHRLTMVEASVKMAMVNERYLLEVEQLNKTNMYKERIIFPPEAAREVRQGMLELMKDDKLMVFLTPDEEIIYALIDDKPYH